MASKIDIKNLNPNDPKNRKLLDLLAKTKGKPVDNATPQATDEDLLNISELKNMELNTDELAKVRTLISHGFTVAAIAQRIGMSPQDLQTKLDENKQTETLASTTKKHRAEKDTTSDAWKEDFLGNEHATSRRGRTDQKSKPHDTWEDRYSEYADTQNPQPEHPEERHEKKKKRPPPDKQKSSGGSGGLGSYLGYQILSNYGFLGRTLASVLFGSPGRKGDSGHGPHKDDISHLLDRQNQSSSASPDDIKQLETLGASVVDKFDTLTNAIDKGLVTVGKRIELLGTRFSTALEGLQNATSIPGGVLAAPDKDASEPTKTPFGGILGGLLGMGAMKSALLSSSLKKAGIVGGLGLGAAGLMGLMGEGGGSRTPDEGKNKQVSPLLNLKAREMEFKSDTIEFSANSIVLPMSGGRGNDAQPTAKSKPDVAGGGKTDAAKGGAEEQGQQAPSTQPTDISATGEIGAMQGGAGLPGGADGGGAGGSGGGGAGSNPESAVPGGTGGPNGPNLASTPLNKVNFSPIGDVGKPQSPIPNLTASPPSGITPTSSSDFGTAAPSGGIPYLGNQAGQGTPAGMSNAPSQTAQAMPPGVGAAGVPVNMDAKPPKGITPVAPPATPIQYLTPGISGGGGLPDSPAGQPPITPVDKPVQNPVIPESNNNAMENFFTGIAGHVGGGDSTVPSGPAPNAAMGIRGDIDTGTNVASIDDFKTPMPTRPDVDHILNSGNFPGVGKAALTGTPAYG